MIMILKDKICVVTGAAQGIGRAIAANLLDEGAIVYGCDLKEGSMIQQAADNDRFHPLYFDVTDAAAAKAAMMQVKKEQARIDVLINNAGVVFNKKIGMIVREETELMFRVNVIAVIELTQLVSRIMARTGGGSNVILSLINISEPTRQG
ncbi:MAG: SDR family oxidoreductase, partial [Muribaculaceae bacterium]|nr:SDR family oxidoreductase [Muribaculaceae bacterium]